MKSKYRCPVCKKAMKIDTAFWDDTDVEGETVLYCDHRKCKCRGWYYYTHINTPPAFRNGIYMIRFLKKE